MINGFDTLYRTNWTSYKTVDCSNHFLVRHAHAKSRKNKQRTQLELSRNYIYISLLTAVHTYFCAITIHVVAVIQVFLCLLQKLSNNLSGSLLYKTPTRVREFSDYIKRTSENRPSRNLFMFLNK